VSDRNGLSYYRYDKICTLLRISEDDYIAARNTLIDKDLIAFDGYLYQVLSLPKTPCIYPPRPLKNKSDMVKSDPATIHQIVKTRFNV
jgi:hypothetical protein